MSVRDEAARQRRKQWRFGLTSKGKASADDLAFWRRASASVKLNAIRAMADESEIIKGNAPPILDRSAGGIRRAQD
jgi:hypothetical protein